MQRLSLFILILVPLAACCHAQSPATAPASQPAPATLTILDNAGQRLAVYTLDIPRLGPADRELKGRITKVISTEKFPAAGAVAKTFTATTAVDRSFSANLSPNNADNNIFLSGKIENGQITGTVSHSTFVGSQNIGTFTITWPPNN